MTMDEKIKDIMKYLEFNPYVKGQQRADIEEMLEQMYEFTKNHIIEKACEWLSIHDSYAIPTNVQVDRLREHLNNIK